MLLNRRYAPATKPAQGAAINWGHPLAQGLVSCVLFNETVGQPLELVLGRPCPLGGTASWTPGAGPGGHGRRSSAGPGYGAITVPNINGRLTLASMGNFWTIRMKVRHLSSVGVIWSHWNSGNDLIVYYASTGTQIQVDIPFVAAILTASGFIQGSVEDIVVTRNGSAWAVYRNGVKVATTTSASVQQTNAVDPCLQKRNVGDNANDWSGDYYEHQCWRRALTDNEIRWLYTEPSALIQQPAPLVRAPGFSNTQIKTVLGLTKPSVKTVDALAIASVKTIGGLQ